MIRRIRGQLVEVGAEHVLLQAEHLCYEVLVAPSTAERLAERPVGSEIELHTFHYLYQEQARSTPVLMGFETDAQRDFFEQLIHSGQRVQDLLPLPLLYESHVAQLIISSSPP